MFHIKSYKNDAHQLYFLVDILINWHKKIIAKVLDNV